MVVIKDARTSKVLWRKFICKKETLFDYQEGIAWLEEHHFQIEGIVCDGLRGMFQSLCKYRVQMCQFHQVKIASKIAFNELLRLRLSPIIAKIVLYWLSVRLLG